MIISELKLTPRDYVLHEGAAAAYSMMARRIAALPPSASNAVQEKAALSKACTHFERAAAARERQSSPCGASADCPQLEFEQPRALSLRAWGDNLNWIGREADARRVFSSSAAMRLWRDPLCRAADHDWAIKRNPLPLGPASSKGYFLDSEAQSALLSYVIQPVKMRLLPPLRRSLRSLRAPKSRGGDVLDPASEWAAEAAGLHREGEWSVAVLWANGRPGDACRRRPGGPPPALSSACRRLRVLLRRLPALNLMDGQIKLSRLAPGTRVRPHAGPSAARLRMHCPVSLPAPLTAAAGVATYLRVGSERRGWSEREGCFVFREDCEHEASISAEAGAPRVVLIVDFANPWLESRELYERALQPSARGEAAMIGLVEGDHFDDGAHGGDTDDEDDDDDESGPGPGGGGGAAEFDAFRARELEMHAARQKAEL